MKSKRNEIACWCQRLRDWRRTVVNKKQCRYGSIWLTSIGTQMLTWERMGWPSRRGHRGRAGGGVQPGASGSFPICKLGLGVGGASRYKSGAVFHATNFGINAEDRNSEQRAHRVSSGELSGTYQATYIASVRGMLLPTIICPTQRPRTQRKGPFRPKKSHFRRNPAETFRPRNDLAARRPDL